MMSELRNLHICAPLGRSVSPSRSFPGVLSIDPVESMGITIKQ